MAACIFVATIHMHTNGQTHTADASVSHSSVLVCERRDEQRANRGAEHKKTLALAGGEQTLNEQMLMHIKDV